MEIKKENQKVSEIRKELKTMLICTYKHFASKDMKEKRTEFVNSLTGIKIKSNKNGDLYAPISNEVVDKIKETMVYFISDCCWEASFELDSLTLKKCVSIAYIDAFTQRHNKAGDLVDVTRAYEFAKMLSCNIWQQAKEIAKKSK